MASVSVTQDQTTGKWFVYYQNDGSGNLKNPKPISFPINALVASGAKLPTDDRTQLLSTPANDPNPMFILAGKSATITVSKDVWAFDDATRARVRTNFDAFLKGLEKLEGTTFLAGSTAYVRRLLAYRLPATFAENSYFNYGFTRPGTAGNQFYVDLQPGMRLRLDQQISQFVSPANAGAAYNARLNGFAGTGQSYYDVVEIHGSDGSVQIGFDAFLAANSLSLAALGDGGAGGLIDLEGAARRRRYVRLCYPAQLPASDSFGASGMLQNVTLIGANDLTTLDQATQLYYNQGAPAAFAQLAGASTTYFRGRVTITPEVLCFVNDTDTPIYMPVGATMRNLIHRFATLPRIPQLDIGSSFPYRRYIPNIQLDGKTPQFRANYTSVNIVNPDTLATSPDDGFDLPVLASDICRFPIGDS